MKFFDQSDQIPTFYDQIQADAFLVILGPDSNFRHRKSEVSVKKYLARCHLLPKLPPPSPLDLIKPLNIDAIDLVSSTDV
jgi:hypothetical protein